MPATPATTAMVTGGKALLDTGEDRTQTGSVPPSRPRAVPRLSLQLLCLGPPGCNLACSGCLWLDRLPTPGLSLT